MALCHINLSYNKSLGRMSSCTAITPEGHGPGPFPVFYLLHGLSDDHTAWTRRTSLERYVAPWPLIVVMPNGERGWYTDAPDQVNAAYESSLIQDLIGWIDGTFQTIASREGRVIGGLSMGGYGAFKLALKYPHLFRAAVSHSGAITFASHSMRNIDPSGERGWLREFLPIFGEDSRGGPEDVLALAEKIDRALLPALRFDCGVDDRLIGENRKVHAHLTQLGIAHEYEEFPGAHDWSYWDKHVQSALRFFVGHLNISKPVK